MIFSGTRRTNRKETYKNKIVGIKRNVCSLSNLTKNAFVLYFSTKKGMKRNKEEKLFLVNGDFFWNDKEFSVPFHSLVTIQSLRSCSKILKGS